ncbi:MAG: cyclase family protein [Planctomycetota bacterium]|jgi:kynurenine formamidase
MKIIDLSHTVRTGMAQYPGDKPLPRIESRAVHEQDGYQNSFMEMNCHLGTHIDTPLHFMEGRPGLEEIALDRFFGKARALDLPCGDLPEAIPPAVLEGIDLESVDFILFRTGWERHWGSDRYYEAWPFVSEALALRLAAARLKGVGLDAPGLDPPGIRTVHDLLAAAGMINVENLANLSLLPGGLFDLVVFPLKLAGAEASPVRAAALVR